jgi:hypothetical protein
MEASGNDNEARGQLRGPLTGDLFMLSVSFGRIVLILEGLCHYIYRYLVYFFLLHRIETRVFNTTR